MQTKAWNIVAESVNFNLEINTNKILQFIPQKGLVLDYGCGYGRTCEILTSLGYKNIIGVDTSSEMIKRGNLEYPHLSLYHSKNHKIAYPDNHFNAILICAVLTCVPNDSAKRKIISEIKRVLVPGGIIHMVEFCNETENKFESKFGVNMHHQTPKTLRNLVGGFSKLSFEVKNVKTMNGKKALAISYFGKNDT